MSNSINTIIFSFVHAAKMQGLCTERDRIYLINRLGFLLGVKTRQEENSFLKEKSLLDLMDDLVDYAASNNMIENTIKAREKFESEIMDTVTPMPGQVNYTFWQKYSINPKLATNYFHNLSQSTNYLKTREIAKDIRYNSKSKYGDLQITINKSKPEKSPKEIMMQEHEYRRESYPKCALCIENEGYEASSTQAARQNHRLIEVNLKNSIFYLQYSPYAYYNEHSIFINKTHKSMVMNRETIAQILEIVDIFPQYFIGSNAELPIVGGSILSHEHFQAGHHSFPMDEAKHFYKTVASAYDNCEVTLLEWPASVIKIQHKDSKIILDLTNIILQKWRNYSNEELNIVAFTEEEVHNSITPIVRKKDDTFEISIVLRNNRTSNTYPNGIFHPHPHLHHIKKENIGLIEVMGMAILPPRIESAMNSIAGYLSGFGEKNDIAIEHLDWVQQLEEKYMNQTDLDWPLIIQKEIGYVFEEILENVGVFKQNELGQKTFIDFIQSCID